MLNLPWFVPCFQDEEEEAAPYFSPFEKQRSRRLRALSRAKKPFHSHLYASFPCGWLMKGDSRSSPPPLCRFYLLNPVTGDEIQIPPIERPFNTYRAAMSPPPGWSLFVIAKRMSGTSLLFLRRGDPDWIRPSSPHDREHAPVESMTSIIFCGGKFWYLSQEDSPFSFLLPPPHPRGMRLFALDPLPAARQPAVCFVEMDRSELPRMMGDKLELFLVESDGEVLLVVEILEDGPVRSILDIHLFRADLSKKMWVRMHGLGDRVLILHVKCSASFLAADLGVPGNHVYCSGSTPWQVFDLGARRLTDESPAFPSSFAHLMFVPSIC